MLNQFLHDVEGRLASLDVFQAAWNGDQSWVEDFIQTYLLGSVLIPMKPKAKNPGEKRSNKKNRKKHTRLDEGRNHN